MIIILEATGVFNKRGKIRGYPADLPCLFYRIFAAANLYFFVFTFLAFVHWPYLVSVLPVVGFLIFV